MISVIAMKKYNRRYTGSHVTRLEENEVFVYAGDPSGRRISGSRQIDLVEAYGARFGKNYREGMTSRNTYAIPCYKGISETKTGKDEYAKMCESVQRLIQYAAAHPDLTFLVPQIGVGGIFKNDIADMAPMFRDAIEVENIILPIEFVLQLRAEEEKGLFNVLVASSDDDYLKRCREELADANIRIVKELSCGKELDEIAMDLVRQENLSRSVDAVVYDPSIPESSDETKPFSGLGTILSVSAAVNYHVHLPFICLSRLSLEEIRSGSSLSGSLMQRVEKQYQPMDRMEVVKDVILKIDSQDSRIRKQNAELFDAADWYDITIKSDDGGSLAGFISSVLRENTTDLMNTTRSFLHGIMLWLVGRGALPNDRSMNPGAYMDLIRDGKYRVKKRLNYYMVAGDHEVPRRLRFMLEAVKENGNVGSHSTGSLDEYINRSVFYAFASFLLWLYREREFFEGGVNGYYAVQDFSEFVALPHEGVLSVRQVDGKEYYFCDNVHLESKDGQAMVPGCHLVIHSAGREDTPKLPGITFFSKDWDFITQ